MVYKYEKYHLSVSQLLSESATEAINSPDENNIIAKAWNVSSHNTHVGGTNQITFGSSLRILDREFPTTSVIGRANSEIQCSLGIWPRYFANSRTGQTSVLVATFIFVVYTIYLPYEWFAELEVFIVMAIA